MNDATYHLESIQLLLSNIERYKGEVETTLKVIDGHIEELQNEIYILRGLLNEQKPTTPTKQGK